MGTSAGGLRALEKILGTLPASFPIPIVAVQHRARESEAFASIMQSLCALPVHEAEDKEPIIAPGIYLAPPDYHLLLEPGHLALSTDEPVSFSRPSIDVLFESAALAYRERLLGVILTGASRDGADGARQLKERGGALVVQDPRSAENPIMPTAALSLAGADQTLQLADIAPFLNRCSRVR
jgi:two-component system chemotaxis response regulator CheB